MNRLFILLILLTMSLISGCSSTSKNRTIDGLKKYESGDISEAKSILQNACNESDRAACLKLSELLNDEDNIVESLTYLQKSCELNNLRACAKLGHEYLIVNRVKEARIAIEKSANINIYSRYNMILLLLAEKNFTEAKKLSNEFCNEKNLQACDIRAYIAYSENDLVTAKKFFSILDGFDESSLLLLGLINYRLNNVQQAEKEIDQACQKEFRLACSVKKLLSLIPITIRLPSSPNLFRKSSYC